MAITKRRFRQVRCQIELIDAAENGLPARHFRENEPLGSRIKWATAVLGMWGVGPAMEDFTFKVNLVAVVRVRAGDESVARKAVPTVLGAPGTVEIGLANENNAATGRHATITDVDFTIGSTKPLGAGS